MSKIIGIDLGTTNSVVAVIEGKDGIIPTPEIFLCAALLMILPLIPVLIAKEKKEK